MTLTNWLTASAAAALAGTTMKAVYVQAQEGKLRFRRLPASARWHYQVIFYKPDVERLAAARQARAAHRAALTREVLAAFLAEGLTNRQIAERLDSTPSAIRARLCRQGIRRT